MLFSHYAQKSFPKTIIFFLLQKNYYDDIHERRPPQKGVPEVKRRKHE